MFNFAASLQTGAVSTNAPIFRLNFTITAALAILLLGETLTWAKAAALVCALLAVWLLLAEPGAKRGQANITSLVRVLIAMVAMALTDLFYKVGLQHGALPETMVSTQAWVFMSLATILRLLQQRLRITPGALALFQPGGAGAGRRLLGADAWARGRTGQRARPCGADELRLHRIDRRDGFSRKP